MSTITTRMRVPTARRPHGLRVALGTLALAVVVAAPFIWRWDVGQAVVLVTLVAVLVLALLSSIALLLVAAVVGLVTRSDGRALGWARRGRRSLTVAGVAVVALAAALALSQALAHTPPIVDAQGQPIPTSIASLEKVRLGGTDQWVVLRGANVNHPVLLFLSGGPGGSELGRVRRFNQPLEERFVVAVWEQRGCGKSYWAGPTTALTVDQYVADVIELSETLRTRFGEDKIYLLGHSWGSIIGVRAVQQRPDLFHAYIGSGQMVNNVETDQTIYRMLLDHAHKSGDTAFAEELAGLGEPPYYGARPIFQYMKVLGREYGIFEAPYIQSERYKREGDLAGQTLIPEYGWLDRVNFMRAAMDTFNVVYPQLQDYDFRRDAPVAAAGGR